MSTLGRPPVESPVGYLSIREAMTARDVSYAVVYGAVQRGEVRGYRNERGEILLDSRDVHKIVKREAQPPAQRDRVHVYLTPDAERYARWEAAASRYGETVSAMAYRVMDALAARIVRRKARKARRKARRS